MGLLSATVQPPLLTLLSSTSQPALSPIFSYRTHASSSSSIVKAVSDEEDALSFERLDCQPSLEKGSMTHPVIHIQGPNIRKTFIQAGGSHNKYASRRNKGKSVAQEPLDIELPYVGLQIRPLGEREFCFDIGLVDAKGREGIIRCSTFQSQASVHLRSDPPVLRLPIQLPPKTPSTLTPWLEISLNLAEFLPLFSTLPRTRGANSTESEAQPAMKRSKTAEPPSRQFGCISYIRIYANCRVRRIWCCNDGQNTLNELGEKGRDEWQLYASASL